MQTVYINDGSPWAAAKYECLPQSGDELEEIVSLLMGVHPSSPELLQAVKPGTVLGDWGAERRLGVVLEEPPVGGFDKGGIYGVTQWVVTTLEVVMPAGWGAVCEPCMFPMLGDSVGAEYTTSSVGDVLRARKAGMPVAYAVILASVDRTKTSIAGAFLNDSDEGPSLILAEHR